MREKTSKIDDTVDSVTRLFYYIENCDDIYTENDQVEQIKLDRAK